MLRIAAARRHAATGTGRRIREAARLTGREVAEVVDVDVTTLHRWETGKSVPQGATAERYARVLEDLQRLVAEAA